MTGDQTIGDFEPPNQTLDGVQTPSSVFRIEIDTLGSINLACHQNDVPLIRSLGIINTGREARSGLVLRATSRPAFMRTSEWAIDRLDGCNVDETGETFNGVVEPVRKTVELDPAMLAGLNESVTGELLFELLDGDTVLASVRHKLRLLARDEWGGVGDMVTMLAAHVSPNHPAIAPLLKSAADQLEQHGHSRSLDGYQSNDPRRAYILVSALWGAVCELGLDYAEPPASFEMQGQKVRDPGRITSEGLATCLDSALLMCALGEATGLNTAIILTRDHAFAGVWLRRTSFRDAVEADPVEVRKALAAREFIVFETTLAVQRPAASFQQACNEGGQRVDERDDDAFVVAVDVARTRAIHIRPLASPDAAHPTPTASRAPTAPALPPLPDLDMMPSYMFEEEASSPKGRVERWKSKLLDLTLNNRLLNFRETKGIVPFLIPNAGSLEDVLASGTTLRVKAFDAETTLAQRDENAMRRAGLDDIQHAAARDAFERRELLVPLNKAETAKRLTLLYRKAKSDLAEGGTNTLFLAIGALKWRKKPGDEKVYRAPLLLLPASLERKAVASGFTLKHFDEEVRFNTTLLEYLRREFEIVIPELEGELPSDDSGIDVPRVLETMRQRIRDVSGFEVVEEATLGTFSFAKYLMWKDLGDRTDALRRNRVVQQLIDAPDQALASGGTGPFPRANELDALYEPADFACPLPADSSQLAAVKAAAEGHDFVIVGPPGTGKSQTIANMIAQILFEGRSILFVAEKAAALNVVHRRLSELGLGDICLELHSNKADRRSFLAQLGRSWDLKRQDSQSRWVELGASVRVRRDRLNDYAAALHTSGSHGESVFDAIARCADWGERSFAEISFRGPLDHEGIERLASLADAAEQAYVPVNGQVGFDLVGRTDFSNRWLSEFETKTRTLIAASAKLLGVANALANELALSPTPNWTEAQLSTLRSVCTAITNIDEGETLAFENGVQSLIKIWPEIRKHVSVALTARSTLSCIYPSDELARVPAADLERQWRAASARLWPFSAFAKRRVRAELAAYTEGGKPTPSTDLSALRRIKEVQVWLSAQPDIALLGEDMLDTNLEAVEHRLDAIGALHAAMRAIGPSFGLDPNAQKSALVRVYALVQRSNTLNPLAKALSDAAAKFEMERLAFEESAENVLPGHIGLKVLITELEGLNQSGGILRDWVNWCSARDAASAAGLSTLVNDIENNQDAADPRHSAGDALRAAYAKWWLPIAMDANPILREFQSHAHERGIIEFRNMTEQLRAESVTAVLNRAGSSLPGRDAVPARSELGLLRHQLALKRPSKSIRTMVQEMPQRFGELAPCVLMSPLSIAQYFPHDSKPFDVVIFDEASQITTWDAVGAIARGTQTIIVGDPKQLPPTNFFERNDSNDGDEEGNGGEFWSEDQASILDEAAAVGLKRHLLRWHYRSQFEELIAFSNHAYYENELITFPPPRETPDAVRLHRIENGVYDRGKSRTNAQEARAVANHAVSAMTAWLDIEEVDRPTLGIVTFNAQQQSLISDLLDDARLQKPDLEWFFADDRVEPTIVRNLENVQGDERDVILFSLTFAKDGSGKFTMNFGALNSDGGERRLNVAVTRARARLDVFASFGAADIDLRRTGARGVADLKRFLDYADRGAIALAAADEGSVGGYDSPFERQVAEALVARGWDVRTQIGVSGYRVDLGVVHPEHPGAYLCGIECDGATYHSGATARDRDMVRESVLRGLGWEIERVWSTDWWQDPKRVTDRLHESLVAFLATEPAQGLWQIPESNLVLDEAITTEQQSNVGATEHPTNFAGNASVTETHAKTSVSESPAPPESFEVAKRGCFRRADLSNFNPDPNAFDTPIYGSVLRDMAQAVIDTEAPVRKDVLAQRIARAHGWQRTGRLIRTRIDAIMPDHELSDEVDGAFIWQPGTLRRRIAWRQSDHTDEPRPVAEICDAELRGLVELHKDVLDVSDPALALSRIIGLSRLAASTRDRLERLLNEGHSTA